MADAQLALVLYIVRLFWRAKAKGVYRDLKASAKNLRQSSKSKLRSKDLEGSQSGAF